jgi:hypothetical protein
MSNKQAPGGDTQDLPANFSGALSSAAKETAPSIQGSQKGGNATGPALTENRGKQGQG